jgi:hypothetical protein
MCGSHQRVRQVFSVLEPMPNTFLINVQEITGILPTGMDLPGRWMLLKLKNTSAAKRTPHQLFDSSLVVKYVGQISFWPSYESAMCLSGICTVPDSLPVGIDILKQQLSGILADLSAYIDHSFQCRNQFVCVNIIDTEIYRFFYE